MDRKRLPVDDLVVDAIQSRETAWTGDRLDQQLAASVEDQGILQDLIVRPIPETTDEEATHAIVAGSRRYYAAMEAGYEHLWCKIVDLEDLEAAWVSLTENTDRRDLSEAEVAQQLKFIYELVRPKEPPSSCPECGRSVSGEQGLRSHIVQTDCAFPRDPQSMADNSQLFDGKHPSQRFTTDYQAREYLAQRYLGRSDDQALELINGHLRTAELPPLLRALFKKPAERSDQERMAIQNYNIDPSTVLGSGEGRSGTSREVAKLYETLDDELAEDRDGLAPTDAVLEAVGSFTYDGVSEQELRQTLRDLRRDFTAKLDPDASGVDQRELFTDIVQKHSAELQKIHEKIEPARPFRRIDVPGPESQQHSRWHALIMNHREVQSHSNLVKQLYEERLERLAEEHGWK